MKMTMLKQLLEVWNSSVMSLIIASDLKFGNMESEKWFAWQNSELYEPKACIICRDFDFYIIVYRQSSTTSPLSWNHLRVEVGYVGSRKPIIATRLSLKFDSESVNLRDRIRFNEISCKIDELLECIIVRMQANN